MGIAVNALQKVRETADTLAPTPESLRNSAASGLENAYNTLKGSGYLMTELGRAKDAALGIVGGAIGTPLQAAAKLLTFRPIEATRTLVDGLINTCKDVGSFVAAPLPIAKAAAQSSLRTVKDAAVATVNVPKEVAIKGYNTVFGGLNTMLEEIYGSGAGSNTPATPSKASEIGGAAASSPDAPQAV